MQNRKIQMTPLCCIESILKHYHLHLRSINGIFADEVMSVKITSYPPYQSTLQIANISVKSEGSYCCYVCKEHAGIRYCGQLTVKQGLLQVSFMCKHNFYYISPTDSAVCEKTIYVISNYMCLSYRY